MVIEWLEPAPALNSSRSDVVFQAIALDRLLVNIPSTSQPHLLELIRSSESEDEKIRSSPSPPRFQECNSVTQAPRYV